MSLTKALAMAGLAAAAAGAVIQAAPPAPDSRGSLYVLTVTGVIDPVVSEYLAEGLRKAESASAQAVLIRLDTPGGLLDSTRDIIGKMLNAPLPVIAYVSPRGARAASAGVFITVAADVAAMAPETHIGAAHPVSIGGSPFGPGDQKKSTEPASGSAMEEKAVSDAAAYIRGLAAAKGRNAAWAEKAVRDSVSLTADEALKQNVIDVLAKDEAELLKALQGRPVKKNDKTYTLDLENAARVPFDMGRIREFLHTLINPNIAYILLMLGFYALIYEFASPGVGVGAVAGVICLVMAFYALQVLPVNYAGVALLATGLLFMLLDLKVPSYGLLSVGGLACFVLGSLLLFDSYEPYFRVSLQLVAGTAVASAGFILFAVKKVWETRQMVPATGREGLLNEVGEARENGVVFVQGEYWTADSDQPLSPGDKIRVVQVVGNRLRVRKTDENSREVSK
jgi:membrane-bound serine protease (ClpP class)